jgi:hypothetical protein
MSRSRRPLPSAHYPLNASSAPGRTTARRTPDPTATRPATPGRPATDSDASRDGRCRTPRARGSGTAGSAACSGRTPTPSGPRGARGSEPLLHKRSGIRRGRLRVTPAGTYDSPDSRRPRSLPPSPTTPDTLGRPALRLNRQSATAGRCAGPDPNPVGWTKGVTTGSAGRHPSDRVFCVGLTVPGTTAATGTATPDRPDRPIPRPARARSRHPRRPSTSPAGGSSSWASASTPAPGCSRSPDPSWSTSATRSARPSCCRR